MAPPLELMQRVVRQLEGLESSGLRRHLRSPAGIDLSSNDYLGLAKHPQLKQSMAEAALRDGCGATASRLLRGHSDRFAALERRFAQFKHTEAALFFGSGYAANLGVLTTFLEPGDAVFSDTLNHASLIDGIRLAKTKTYVFPHADVEAVSQLIRSENISGQKFLVTESLFSMDGDKAPLADYSALCRETNTALIVDEAHAVGIYGERGSGLIEESGIEDDVFLSINTCGKALGVCGAFVAGPAWAIEALVQRARTFIFSTASPPPVAAALDAALTLIAEEPQRRLTLRQRSQMLRTLLRESGFNVPAGDTQIIPLILGGNESAVAAATTLQAEGFDVRAIRPPTVPPGTARLRISVNVQLDETTLRRFAAAVARIAKPLLQMTV